MHELSVAQNIVDIVLESVTEKDRSGVKTILIEVGEMSGIVPDSLKFCFDVIKTETPLKNSEMQITKIPFVLYCSSCNKETTNDLGMRSCGSCGCFDTKIVSGTEMKITELEVNT